MAMEGEGYSLRRYRTQTDADLKSFRVTVKETDLLIRVDKAGFREGLASKVETMVLRNRSQLEDYLKKDVVFGCSLTPCLVGPEAPLIARRLVLAANPAGVGPMAAVAGVFAALTGEFLRQSCREVIVENGGDIYLASSKKRLVSVLAGSSPFNCRLALEVPPGSRPFGVCTSSGSVGPSFSLGTADAAVVLSHDVPLADAVATAAANRVQDKQDVEEAVQFALTVKGVLGALVIKEDMLAVRGAIKLVPLKKETYFSENPGENI